MDHDERCEADWNDGICACHERSLPPLTLNRPEPCSTLRRIARRLALHH